MTAGPPGIPAHASVPRWPATPPRVDLSGRTYGIVAADDCPVARRWRQEIGDRPCWRASPGELTAALADATVGLRVLVSGPEVMVLAVRAELLAAGLTDAELVVHATSFGERSLYCVHCATTSVVAAGVGETAACSSCGIGLTVFAHLAARTGSYLGFRADAEEVA